jgi:hypothetical protein
MSGSASDAVTGSITNKIVKDGNWEAPKVILVEEEKKGADAPKAASNLEEPKEQPENSSRQQGDTFGVVPNGVGKVGKGREGVEENSRTSRLKVTMNQEGTQQLLSSDNNQQGGNEGIKKQEIFCGIAEPGAYKNIGGSHKSGCQVHYLVGDKNVQHMDGFTKVYLNVSVLRGIEKPFYLSPGVRVVVDDAELIYLGTGTHKGLPTQLVVCGTNFQNVQEISPAWVSQLAPPPSSPDLNMIMETLQQYGASRGNKKHGTLGETPASSSPEDNFGTDLNDSVVSDGKYYDPVFAEAWTPKNPKRVSVPHGSSSSVRGTVSRSQKKKVSKKRPTSKIAASSNEGEENFEAKTKAPKVMTSKGRAPIPSVPVEEPSGAPLLDPQMMEKCMQVAAQHLGGMHHVLGNIELHFHFDGKK